LEVHGVSTHIRLGVYVYLILIFSTPVAVRYHYPRGKKLFASREAIREVLALAYAFRLTSEGEFEFVEHIGLNGNV
jgi:hypothetical protein